MSTKHKILKTALDLFNEKGVEKVSVRAIADELNISDGNLRYHFPGRAPTKQSIIIQLYEQMLKEMEDNIIEKQKSAHDLVSSLEYMRLNIEIQYRYKFLLINLIDICRNIPLLQKHYRETTRRRKDVFHYNIQQLIQAGYLRDDISKAHQNNIFTVYHILGNFWAIEADLQGAGEDECLVDYFFKVNTSIMVPYLTPKGLKVYQDYFQKLSPSQELRS